MIIANQFSERIFLGWMFLLLAFVFALLPFKKMVEWILMRMYELFIGHKGQAGEI